MRAPAVCSLWHFPAGHPGSVLPITLPCGARTFLDGWCAAATVRPTRPGGKSTRVGRKDRGPAGHTADVDAARDEARRRFESLAAEVYEPLQRYLRRRVDATTAEDVLGDVLLVLWRRLDEVPDEARLPWSYGVARRCLANSVRSAARQQRLVERLAQEPVAPDSDTNLSEALATLSEADQDLLRLWAWEQLPPREIALALGISPNAASIRLHRATKKLRKQMAARKDRPAAGHLVDRQDREAGR